MTQTMREFLTAWLAWAEDPDAYDLDDGGPFKKRTGLCSNLDDFVGGEDSYYTLLQELGTMLDADGLDTVYPFDTEQSYDLAYDNRTQHLNPARLAWVRSKLESTMNDIHVGLRVVAKCQAGVRSESVGKVARVTSISDSFIHYSYEFDGFVGQIQPKHFWSRFERITDSEPTGVAATSGHCAGNGGLRGHSVGDVFPVVVYQRGNPDSLTHWLRLPDGRDIGPYFNYDDVHSAAAWHKSQL